MRDKMKIMNFEELVGSELVLLKIQIQGVHLTDSKLVSAGNVIIFHCGHYFRVLKVELNSNVQDTEFGDAYHLFSTTMTSLDSRYNNYSYLEFLPEIGSVNYCKITVEEIGVYVLDKLEPLNYIQGFYIKLSNYQFIGFILNIQPDAFISITTNIHLFNNQMSGNDDETIILYKIFKS